MYWLTWGIVELLDEAMSVCVGAGGHFYGVEVGLGEDRFGQTNPYTRSLLDA